MAGTLARAAQPRLLHGDNHVDSFEKCDSGVHSASKTEDVLLNACRYVVPRSGRLRIRVVATTATDHLDSRYSQPLITQRGELNPMTPSLAALSLHGRRLAVGCTKPCPPTNGAQGRTPCHLLRPTSKARSSETIFAVVSGSAFPTCCD